MKTYYAFVCHLALDHTGEEYLVETSASSPQEAERIIRGWYGVPMRIEICKEAPSFYAEHVELSDYAEELDVPF